MFLALTADDHFWNKDEEVLFLGEWCLRYDRKKVWKDLSYRVMKYPWDNREKMFSDYLYLDDVYERVLRHLSEKLNTIHGTRHSLRYWRILCGSWLCYYIQILFERYLCLSSAINDNSAMHTNIVSEAQYIIPGYFSHFAKLYQSDAYNMVLYSQLIKVMGKINYAVRQDIELKTGDNGYPLSPNVPKNFYHRAKRFLVEGLLKCARWNRIALVGTYMPIKKNITLHFKLKQFPLFSIPDKSVPPSFIDDAKRKELVISGFVNEFERLICQTIPRNIPQCYVENYRTTRMEAMNFLPMKPHVIATANYLTNNDLFNFWAAEKVEGGAKLIGMQHGGQYGCGKWNSDEKHERAVTDRYYTWGWEDAEDRKVFPHVATKLLWKSSLNHKKKGNILWAIMSLPRYSYCMYSIPVASQHHIYLEDQKRFAKSVQDKVLSLLVCRPYMVEYGWREDLQLKEAVPGLKISHGKKMMSQELQESRLFVGTYNATAFLEALASNHPTILFWNPSFWELRSSAQPYFDDLHRCGILHYTPEEAASRVNEIFEDPEIWWRQPSIQQVRERFCHKFVRTSENWLEKWAEELRQLAKEQRGIVTDLN